MSLAAFLMLFPSSVPSITINSCSKPGAAVGIADTVANVCLILQWSYKWRTESYTPHISKRKGTQQELGKQTVVGDSAFTRIWGWVSEIGKGKGRSHSSRNGLSWTSTWEPFCFFSRTFPFSQASFVLSLWLLRVSRLLSSTYSASSLTFSSLQQQHLSEIPEHGALNSAASRHRQTVFFYKLPFIF